MAAGQDSPLSHVLDHNTLEIPWVGQEILLPEILGVQVTRFMVMELVAAALMLVILIPLARHTARSRVTRGRLWNTFEAVLIFIRDGIARPAIDGGADGQSGSSDSGSRPRRLSDRFLPFLWTLFFFILFCNLLGMIPGGASATGNINVTGTLALLTLLAVISAGMGQMGPIGFWLNIVPKMDVPAVLKPVLWLLMFFIELAGLLIRHIVLAIRLFANMVAGHIILAVILGFAFLATAPFSYVVTPVSLTMGLALSFLEIFVAFLHAYIFTFLAALFIGMAAHPH